jgi:hypothetical protein
VAGFSSLLGPDEVIHGEARVFLAQLEPGDELPYKGTSQA